MQHTPIYSLDPLRDPRWSELVRRHPNASAFHAAGWLRALQRTYRYEPVAFTTSAPSEALRNALVVCAVRSWLTGSRLVSLPFSDHCEPLVQDTQELSALVSFARHIGERQGCKYLEIRWGSSAWDPGYQPLNIFYLHRLDLRPDLGALLRGFHRNCVQRKIRRAEREGLTYEAGRSESLLLRLYDLLRRTRRRHQIPVQPFAWFRHLVECMGGNACIRIASKRGQPVAGILTLSHGKRVVYKYGGSEARLNNLGGMALLFWKAIQEAKAAGAEEFDWGRSDHDNSGLIAFKEHWGARRSTLTYWRSPAEPDRALREGWRLRLAKRIFARLPDRGLTLAGKLLYRHVG